MNTYQISIFQLCALMTLFLLGSTLLFGINLEAGEDSAIPVLISMMIGTGLFYGYVYLFSKSSWPPFVTLLRSSFGRLGAKVVGMLYAVYFLYIAGRVLRDFAFAITQYMYQETPPWVISLPFLFVIGYSMLLGLEAIARSAELLFFLVVGIYVVLLLFGFLSEEFEAHYLFPLFQTDLGTLWGVIFPQSITFPYGELAAFMVILPSIKRRAGMRRYVWIPIAVSSLISVLVIELVIGILHIPYAQHFYFPFMKSLESIVYMNFIQHLEIFTTLLQLCCGFIKIAVFFYAALEVVSHITMPTKRTWTVGVLAGVIFALSAVNADTLTNHLFVGLELVPYLHLLMQIGIPLLIGCIVLVRARKKQHTYANS